MNYSEALEYIHSLEKFGIKPGLERMDALGGTGEADNFFHIAGTNGKGSTCNMIASALQAAEYKAGLFTSPYVVDFRERIQINGEYIDEKSIAEYVTAFAELAEYNAKMGLYPTEFEFITAIAFAHFSGCRTHYNVMETGLGGRLDSTNVIKSPLCSVITNIALDHTAVLGDTIQQIAYEKAGIIKKGCPVVIAPQQHKEALDILLKTAESKNAPAFLCDMEQVNIIKCDIAGSVFTFEGNEYEVSMIGRHQIENAITAIRALEVSGITISYSQIAQGLSMVSLPARLEVLCHDPLVILDGAHNPDGARALFEALKQMKDEFHMVVGMMADKDTNEVLKIISPLCKRATVCDVAKNARAISSEELSKMASKYIKQIDIASDYDDALEKTLTSENILICGSLYLAGDIRQKATEYYNKL